MVDALIERSNRNESGFYLYEHQRLEKMLIDLCEKNQPVILIGVTFALLDFANNRELFLPQTVDISNADARSPLLRNAWAGYVMLAGYVMSAQVSVK